MFLHTLLHTSRYSTCKNICYTYAHSHQGAFSTPSALCIWACIHVYELNVQVLLSVYVHMYTYIQAGSLPTSYLCLPLCTKPSPPTLKYHYTLPSLPPSTLKQAPQCSSFFLNKQFKENNFVKGRGEK